MSPRVQVPFRDFLRIAERDGWLCHWCEDGYRAADPWEIDHLKSIADGGTNHVSNLGLCHRECNGPLGKGALSVSA